MDPIPLPPAPPEPAPAPKEGSNGRTGLSAQLALEIRLLEVELGMTPPEAPRTGPPAAGDDAAS